MKVLIKYGTFVTHYVSCKSNSEVNFCVEQLKLSDISHEIINLTYMSDYEKAKYPRADFSFERFKKDVLK